MSSSVPLLCTSHSGFNVTPSYWNSLTPTSHCFWRLVTFALRRLINTLTYLLTYFTYCVTTSWLAAATQTRASIIPVSPWVLRQMPFLPQPSLFPGLGLAQNAGTATSSSFRQSNCLHMDGVLLVFQAHLFGTACWIILETTHYPMIHSGAISKPTFCTP